MQNFGGCAKETKRVLSFCVDVDSKSTKYCGYCQFTRSKTACLCHRNVAIFVNSILLKLELIAVHNVIVYVI